MTPHHPHLSLENFHARATARARLRERQGRARRLRRRVVAATVGLFVASWAVIGVQLATGHDPALTRDARLRRLATATLSPKRITTPEVRRHHKAHTSSPSPASTVATPAAATPAVQVPQAATPAPAPVVVTPVLTRQS